jgi:hypothetical protein
MLEAGTCTEAKNGSWPSTETTDPNGARRRNSSANSCRRDSREIQSDASRATARSASNHKDSRFSDHAPLTVDYGFDL